MVTNGQNSIDTTSEIIARQIPVALLSPSPLNRKSSDNDPDIAELAHSIDENGLLSPISARPMDGGTYEIIWGERRWRAVRLLQQETIACFIRDLDDTQAQIERIVENYQRRDPSFMEQGEAVAALLQLTDRDVAEVANRLGQSVSWVRRRTKLPNLIPAWREELAKDETPYYAIRDSVGKMEEIAVLPPATQQVLLDNRVLRHVKTTKEIRSTIARYFMDLDAKPWTRAWEKKAFTGYGKKRCDACMRRSDRENALFADPDDANSGKKMCLDPVCWKSKCLAWCKNLIAENPGMVPMRQAYNFGDDNFADYFGIPPVSYCDWYERDDSESGREGYIAAVGVVIDGPEIGTTKNIWLEAPDSDEEDSEISQVHSWRQNHANKYQERQALAMLMAADITAYLADIDTNATIHAAQLAANQLRAAVWFGLNSYADSEEEDASIDNPDWNPLAWAWERTAEQIGEFVAGVAAEDIAQLHNGDRNATDANTAAALTAMFEIPLDTIATRASEELHKATSGEQDKDRDEPEEDEADDYNEPIAIIHAPEADDLTDPDDSIPYFPVLADAQ